MKHVKCSCFSDIDANCRTEVDYFDMSYFADSFQVKTMLDALSYYQRLGKLATTMSVPKFLHLTSLADVRCALLCSSSNKFSPANGKRQSADVSPFLADAVVRRMQDYEDLRTRLGDTTATSAYQLCTASLTKVIDSFSNALKVCIE